MNDEKLTLISKKYEDVCKRLDTLEEYASYGNADVKSTYEQCRSSLQNDKEILDRYLQQLTTSDNENEKLYVYRCAEKAISKLVELIETAEIRIKNIQSIPPFLY